MINLLNDGWLREHLKEHVIASFEIRLTDIDKSSFDLHGYIKLPINEIIDFKKYGLKPQPEYEAIMARKKP